MLRQELTFSKETYLKLLSSENTLTDK